MNPSRHFPARPVPEGSPPGGGPPPGPASPPRPKPLSLWEGLLPVVLFAASQPLVSVLASLWLLPHLPAGLSERELEDALNRVVLPLLIFVSHAVGWLSLYWVYSRRRSVGLLRGLRLQGLHRFRVGRIFLAGMVLQWLAVALDLLLPHPEDLDNPVLRIVSYGPWAVVMLAVTAAILAPFLEEALFRGVMLTGLKRRMGFLPAAVIVTLVFTALHAMQTNGYLSPLIAIALLGFGLAWLREASGSLWPPVILHMGYNSAVLLILLAIGGDLDGLGAMLSTRALATVVGVLGP